MKKIFLIFSILLCSITTLAQDLELGDNFFSRRYNKITYDTSYISRPKGTKWVIKPRIMMTWQDFDTHGHYEGTEYWADLRSDLKPKLNLQVGYMGIALAAGITFNKLAGKENRDFDIKVNMYGKSFGFEAGVSMVTTLHGTYRLKAQDGDTLYDITLQVPDDFVTQVIMNLNCYYAFNHKKFSYPAAFTQMFIQKKSAGSILAGGEFHLNAISIGDSIQETEVYQLNNVTLGLGVGYGYNLVIKEKLLLHLSCLPYLVFHGGSSVRNYGIGDVRRTNSRFPEFFIASRGAVVYNFNERWFAGATVQINYSNVNTHELTTNNTQWQTIGFVGVRL